MSVIVVLFSSTSADQIQIVGQRRLETLLMGYRYEYEEIDASEPDNKAIREELFELSNQRGKFPQIFIKTDDKYEFAGLWDEVESWNECEELPREFLEANPSIKTITKVFATVLRRPASVRLLPGSTRSVDFEE